MGGISAVTFREQNGNFENDVRANQEPPVMRSMEFSWERRSTYETASRYCGSRRFRTEPDVVFPLDVESTHGGGAMPQQVIIKFTVVTWDTTLAPTVSTEL